MTGAGGYGTGAAVGKLVLVRSTITGFGAYGILAYGRPRLIDSTVIGNGLHPSCTDECVDVASTVAPVLRGTSTCGTSREVYSYQPWGVCTGD